MTIEVMELDKKTASRQSWGHVIQYLDGWSWGIAVDGTTICLGTEDSVKAAIANPKLHSGYENIDAVVELERQLRKEYELEYGQSGIVETKPSRGKRAISTSRFRAGPITHLKHKPVGTGHLKARKRFSRR